MRFELPPALVYAFGAVLMILGGMRAYHLGWKRKREEELAAAEAEKAALQADDDDDDDDDEGGAAARSDAWRRKNGGGYKRHLAWGMLWVAMGLFLIVSTLLKSR